jgi:PAS domain S-box-containing protein
MSDTDSTKVELLIKLALEYRQHDTKKVFTYANQALELATALSYEKGVADANNRLGSFYRQTGNYDRAIDFYLKALKYYDQQKDLKGMSFCYNGVGSIFRVQQLYDKAVDYLQKALDISIELNDSVGMSIYYRNIGMCYYDEGKYPESLTWTIKSLEIAKLIDNPTIKVASYQAVGNSYSKLDEVLMAIYYYNEAYTLGKELGNNYSEAYTLNRLGECYTKQKKFSKAEQSFFQSLELAKRLNIKYDIKDSYYGLSTLYGQQGDFQNAYKYHLLFSQYNDSIFTLESTQKISQIEQLYEMEQQQMKIEVLTKSNELNSMRISRQNNITFGVIAFFLILSLFVIIMARNYKKINRANRLLRLQNREIIASKREIENQSKELKKLSIVASNTSNAIMIIKPNGDIEWVNDSFTRIYGYTLEGFITERGKNITRVSSNSDVQRHLENCIYNHEPTSYNVQVPCFDGSWIWIQTTITPIWNPDGSIQYFVAIDTDITPLKEFEANLVKMSDELLEKAMDLQQKNEEISNQRDNLAQLNAELQQKNEEISTQHDYLMMLNGELKLKNEEIEAQRDELQKTQHQLIHSEKMASLGVLTAGIAHEINNPINFVYAGSNILKRDYEDIELVIQQVAALEASEGKRTEIVQELIQLNKELSLEETSTVIKQTIADIQLGAKRTAKIVEGLRNYARVEKEEWRQFDLHRIIEGVLQLLLSNYKDRVEIVKYYHSDIPVIQCKSGRLDQAFLNILTNAIEAIGDKGQIVVSTKMEKANVIVSIKDNGCGIPSDVVTKIFDPFFTTKTVGQGIGLGLTISYGIVQEHCGTIHVNSQKGKGTEIIVELPISQFSENA